VLSSFVGKADRLTQYITSCKQWGIDVLPPDVNSSGREFTPLAEGIRFGLAGIRGVGEAAAKMIIAEREAGGRFTSLHDFVFRVSNTACNKRAVEALVKAGAFDSTGYTRRQMMLFLEEHNLMDIAAKRWRDKADGQVSLFDMFAEEGIDSGFVEDIPVPDGVEWDRRTKLGFEKEILKMYVSDHPLNPYADALAKAREFSIGDLAVTSGGEDEGLEDKASADKQAREVPQNRPIMLAGMISGVTMMLSRKGERMAKFILEDIEGSIEAILFPTYYEKYGPLLVDDAIVKVRCRYDPSDRGVQILVSEIYNLSLANEKPRARGLEVFVLYERFNQQLSDGLMSLLKRYPGPDPVILSLRQRAEGAFGAAANPAASGSASYRTGGKKLRADLPFTVDASSSELRARLTELLGEDGVR